MDANTKNVNFNIESQGKNMVVAYLLWWFLGWLGIHRLYLGRPATGVAQGALMVIGTATTFIFIGFFFLIIWGVWWMADAYFVQKYVKNINAAQGLPASTGFTFKTTQQGGSNLDQLERLHDLHKKGVLTDAEYQAKRAEFI